MAQNMQVSMFNDDLLSFASDLLFQKHSSSQSWTTWTGCFALSMVVRLPNVRKQGDIISTSWMFHDYVGFVPLLRLNKFQTSRKGSYLTRQLVSLTHSPQNTMHDIEREDKEDIINHHVSDRERIELTSLNSQALPGLPNNSKQGHTSNYPQVRLPRMLSSLLRLQFCLGLMVHGWTRSIDEHAKSLQTKVQCYS